MEERQTTQSSQSLNPILESVSADPIIVGYDLSRYQYFLASPFFAGFDNFQDTKRKLFLEEFKQMPPNIRLFLTSVETASAIFSTGKDSNLEEYQIYQVAELVRDLISGKLFIKDVPALLAQKINIDNPRAGEIANKIISQSFGSILEDVKRIQRSKFPEKIMQLQKEGKPEGLIRSEAPRLVPQKPVLPPPPWPLQQVQGRPFDSLRPSSGQVVQGRPEFKIPDLGQTVTKENGNDNRAKKSLEEELEKVASVIDLRSKSSE